MYKQSHYFSAIFLTCSLFISTEVFAQDIISSANSSSNESESLEDDNFDFTLRFGQGGFRDSRSPEGGLGGGQLAFDIKPVKSPVAYSISSEYYTNSADPTHSYEISGLVSLNVLYMAQLFDYEKTNYFIGGGIGRLKVPTPESATDSSLKGRLYNLEAGIHIQTFRTVGFYATAKYLSAQREVNNIKVINFNESILLLGITYNFSM